MDLGCGSGVLGLYALVKGYCRRVVFIDIQEDALQTTLNNIVLNGMLGRSIVVSSYPAFFKSTFDVVLANPPYLPGLNGRVEDETVEGGRYGFETLLYFIDAAFRALKRGGLLILVYSSLSNPEVIEKHLHGRFDKVAQISKRLFYEVIYAVGVVKKSY